MAVDKIGKPKTENGGALGNRATEVRALDIPLPDPNSTEYNFQNIEYFRTAGTRHNKESFTIRAPGAFWHFLVKYLEGQAVDSPDFEKVRFLVLTSSELRKQLREQGF